MVFKTQLLACYRWSNTFDEQLPYLYEVYWQLVQKIYSKAESIKIRINEERVVVQLKNEMANNGQEMNTRNNI